MAIFDGNPAQPVLYIMLDLHDCDWHGDHPDRRLPELEWSSRPHAEEPRDICVERRPPPRACT